MLPIAIGVGYGLYKGITTHNKIKKEAEEMAESISVTKRPKTEPNPNTNSISNFSLNSIEHKTPPNQETNK